MADEILNITVKVVSAIKSERVKKVALTTVLSRHKPRIFESGMAADGSKLGTYSTNPISIARSRQARNTGQTFFKGGYSEYKRAIGKNPGYVNLNDTGQMASDYGLIASGEQYAFGFQNPVNADKMQWMQEKYEKEIAHLSAEEMELLVDVLTDELSK